MDLSRGYVTAGRIGCDDKSFVASAAKVLQHPQYRIGDSIDIGQE